MRRLMAATAVLVSTLGLVSGCGEDTPATDAGDIETIEITFEGGTVTPNGERVEVGTGQPVDLVVRADESGEIHVHSEPEQEFEYAAGTTTLKLQIDQPGVVEVESHDLEQVIVQLEVS
ncbi:hypothetical protein [Nocardioides sp.]|uniref:hypothetical protein n=1 Tax=Nocardioides sp. TaxID=35761 RepID=UPI00286B23E4|nr:hypothetical protein [Nocardioides sp.]